LLGVLSVLLLNAACILVEPNDTHKQHMCSG
jgi:hypothetical protein